MAKITSKLQVTIPKKIADEYGIAPGDSVEFEPAGPVIRLVPSDSRKNQQLSLEERLRLFDESQARVRAAQRHLKWPSSPRSDRGWTREELYTRGEPR